MGSTGSNLGEEVGDADEISESAWRFDHSDADGKKSFSYGRDGNSSGKRSRFRLAYYIEFHVDEAPE